MTYCGSRKRLVLSIAVLRILAGGAASLWLAAASAATQADIEQLDAACETAREAKLAPERAAFVDECVAGGRKHDECVRFYADHGQRAGNRPPLYLDLPECVEAFELRRSTRSRS